MPVLLTLALLAQQTLVNPTPLDANDPRVKSIAAFVTVLTTSDLASAADYLKKNAVPDSPAAKNPAEQLQPFEELANSGSIIDRVVGGLQEGSFVVLLGRADGGRGGRSAVIVELETQPPHRIRALRNMMVRRVESREPEPTMGEDPTARRARELVEAINSDKEADRRAFIKSASNGDVTHEELDAALNELAMLRHRLGDGLSITRIESKPDGTLVHVVNKQGRKWTIKMVVGFGAPYRITINEPS